MDLASHQFSPTDPRPPFGEVPGADRFGISSIEATMAKLAQAHDIACRCERCEIANAADEATRGYHGSEATRRALAAIRNAQARLRDRCAPSVRTPRSRSRRRTTRIAKRAGPASSDGPEPLRISLQLAEVDDPATVERVVSALAALLDGEL